MLNVQRMISYSYVLGFCNLRVSIIRIGRFAGDVHSRDIRKYLEKLEDVEGFFSDHSVISKAITGMLGISIDVITVLGMRAERAVLRLLLAILEVSFHPNFKQLFLKKLMYQVIVLMLIL